jgi:hypothetical protein
MVRAYDDTGVGGDHPRTDYSVEDDTTYGEGDDTRTAGTVLEAAFVDPAYQWPPPDGQGKNAIELKASQSLMADLDDPTKEFDRDTQRFFTKKAGIQPGQKGIKHTKTVLEDHSYRGFWCCKWNVKNQVAEIHREDPFEVDQYGQFVPVPPGTPPKEQAKSASPKSGRQSRKESRYGKVPEGILIYRLNTTTRRLELLSQPHTNTDTTALVRDMIIASASPSTDRSRRGMDLVGTDGTRTTLVACEQRTAIAWLEVLDMMFGKGNVRAVQYHVLLELGRLYISSLTVSLHS